MKIGFRTDASSQIGSGHVRRCLALAKGLSHLECVFICREHEGNLIENIRQEGFTCLPLPFLESESQPRYVGETSLAHTDWLGATQIEDAEQTIDLLGFEKLDWLIVDHYAIDELWEKKLRSCANKIMVIDDLSDRRHDCDVILDQNLVANFEIRYRDLVPEFCAQLMGPRYALLQPEYNELRRRTPPRIGKINRILVSFGATDQLELIIKIVRAFQSLGRTHIRLDVVAPQYENLASLIAQEAAESSNIFVYSNLCSLAHLMGKADLAIGACGVTTWERCCLGLPSLVITLAENQEPIAAELHRRGLVQWLGRHNEISQQILSDSLRFAIDEILLENWSKACMSITDGGGVRRVASVICLNSETKLTARFASPDDELTFFDLDGDKEMQRRDTTSDSVPQEKYREFFFRRLRSPDQFRLYIVETKDGYVVARLCFELKNQEWAISYRLVPIAINRGLDKNILAVALNKFCTDWTGTNTFSGIVQDVKYFEGIPRDVSPVDERLSISICSDSRSWINKQIAYLLIDLLSHYHACSWVHSAECLSGGDLCFYISYQKIVGKHILDRFQNNLVVHASDLPRGRGWSPSTWMILEGQTKIPVSMMEADIEVDAGPIYRTTWIDISKTDLVEDWRSKLSNATFELILDFVKTYPRSAQVFHKQIGNPTFYRKRSRDDSRLDISRSIADQFNLMRVVDNEKYPAFFEVDGVEFVLTIVKRKPEE